MGLREVKKELDKLDKKEIIDIISDLYKKNKAAKEYFDFFAQPDENKLFKDYRDKVFYSFYPKRGFNYSLKNGKKAISDFKKLGPSDELVAELMLFYVETGVDFTNDFGDIDDAFYTSLAKTFDSALGLLYDTGSLEKYHDKVKNMIDKTGEIGWGFDDYIRQTYYNYFSDMID
ncbi:MAG: hypothetical protein JXQ87_19665 [Bacteroidia bacterium]